MKTKNRPSMARVSKIPPKSFSFAAPAVNEISNMKIVNGIDPTGGDCPITEIDSPQYQADRSCDSPIDGFEDIIVPETPFSDDVCTNDDIMKTLNWDSLGNLEWTEEVLCVRCNKGDQVLSCNSSQCELAVHESCLGCPPFFDDTGKFYCPLCAYKQVIAEFEEAEKEIVMEKRKVELERKSVFQFVNGPIPDEPPNTIPRKEVNQSNVDADGNHPCSNHDVTRIENSGGVSEQVENHLGKGVEDHLVVDAARCTNGKFRVETSLINERSGVPLIPRKHAEEEIDKMHPSNRQDAQHRYSEATIGFETSNSSHESEDIAATDAEPRREETVVEPRTVDAPQKSSPQRIFDWEETVEIGNRKNVASRKSIKHYKSAKRPSNPVLPNSRRRKLCWTYEEERMLKEAVHTFTSTTKKNNISWLHILEYGGHIFNKSRTPGDLRDKWRNMEKDGPKAKKR